MWILWGKRPQGQAMRIGGVRQDASASWPTPSVEAKPEGPPYVTYVSPNGRYFLDQYRKPFLVKGDSPWALMTRLSPVQAKLWFTNRQEHGFNAAIVSLVGSIGNGGPNDDGSTFDGLRPFTDGNILNWQEPYWQRVTAYLRMAADHGITVFLYPVDGWTIGRSFIPESIEQCHSYGRKVAEHFRDLPNIVWMSGGDYIPATKDLAQGSDVDHCIDAMMRGIREAGDGRPFSIQLAGDKSISDDNPYWAGRVDWNFVYTYYPTYRAVLEAYGRQPRIPAIMGEANYEGENNQPETLPTTDQTLRRQVLWALTSGAAGEFAGSHDWAFHDGWEQRLSTPAVTQIERLRNLISGLPWWQLVPDTSDMVVTRGRGTRLKTDDPMDVLDDDYVTAAKTPDGRLAVIYLPIQRTVSVNRGALPAGCRAAWTDPTSGTSHPVPASNTFTTPGTNAGGDADWLLLFTGESPRPAASTDGVPPLALQTEFWNEWNLSFLASAKRNSFQLQQREAAHAAAARAAAGLTDERPLRILDFGCGTGWLGASLTAFGDVTGIDLSPAAIEHGRQEFPDVHLIAGSFTDEALAGPFDLIISSDVLAHVSDQQGYILRAADLLRPGGIFLLMTQNPFVWHRSSQLRPQGRGQIRNWPSLKALREILKGGGFQILSVGSIQPAGDRGVLRVLNSRSLRGVFKLVGLGAFWRTLLERLRVGRDFTIEARRR